MAPKGLSNNHKEIVKLLDARKTYQMGTEEVHALAGVSVSFEQGSFWAIMGPRG